MTKLTIRTMLAMSAIGMEDAVRSSFFHLAEAGGISEVHNVESARRLMSERSPLHVSSTTTDSPPDRWRVEPACVTGIPTKLTSLAASHAAINFILKLMASSRIEGNGTMNSRNSMGARRFHRVRHPPHVHTNPQRAPSIARPESTCRSNQLARDRKST